MNIKHVYIPLLIAALTCTLGCKMLDSMRPAEGSDDAIALSVMDRLQQDNVTATARFDVQVQDGVVSMGGPVDSDVIRLRALSVARGTPGVTEVRDEMRRR
jgi:osmotically-inducible protein OsmY